MKEFSHERVFGTSGRNTRDGREAGEPIGTLRRTSSTKTAVFHNGGLKTYMKRIIFLLVILAVAASPAAFAQFQDILGPHNVNGHGCASCHTPHSGGAGQGIGGDPSTGVNYLWGRDFIAKTYYGFDGDDFTTTSSYTADDPLFHTAACLSCHDGSVTVAGMTGQSFETVNGNKVTTYLASDGYSLTNDHPVHVKYNPGGYNWPGTVGADGKVTFDLTSAAAANFNQNYGHPARFYAVAGQGSYVECSSCHNPHSMNYAKYSISGTSITKPTRFFVRGWYDSANPASNSATQFCRSCHYSKSNEYVGVMSTTN